jgi:hypothetical protein
VYGNVEDNDTAFVSPYEEVYPSKSNNKANDKDTPSHLRVIMYPPWSGRHVGTRARQYVSDAFDVHAKSLRLLRPQSFPIADYQDLD